MSSVRGLVTVYVGLMVLLGISFGSHYLSLVPWHTVIGLSVSAAKTALIGLFFMNLRRASVLVRSLAAASLLWLAILFTLTLADYLHRAPGSNG